MIVFIGTMNVSHGLVVDLFIFLHSNRKIAILDYHRFQCLLKRQCLQEGSVEHPQLSRLLKQICINPTAYFKKLVHKLDAIDSKSGNLKVVLQSVRIS